MSLSVLVYMLAMSMMGLLLFASAALAQPIIRRWTEAERRQLLTGLRQSQEKLLAEISTLHESQLFYQPSPDQWSIAQVVEHLGIQEMMYYREISILVHLPYHPLSYQDSVKGKDQEMLDIATHPASDTATWLLEPTGMFDHKDDLIRYFVRGRNKMMKVIETTDKDFRAMFTWRAGRANIADTHLRDLHQLVLTNIGHTERHINQIRRIKAHAGFPFTKEEEHLEVEPISNSN